MKQKLLVTSLLVVLLVLVGIWAYSFFFANNNPGPGIFSNFGTQTTPNETSAQQSPPSIVDTAPSTSNGETQALRQLTTRRVAAATFIDGGIRYVERGTGYIYDIMFSTGQETRITNTTIPRVVEAAFSESGSRAAMTFEENGVREAIVGTITKNDAGEGVIDGRALPQGARDLRFSDSGEELFFLRETQNGSVAYTYHLAEQTQTRLFSVPLSHIEVLWGDPTYVYTTPSGEQFGHLYEVSGSRLAFVAPKQPGLTAAHFGEYLLLSVGRAQSVETLALSSSTPQDISIQTFTEKCVANPTATGSVYCAVPDNIPAETYPDAWYKGTVSFTDSLHNLVLRSGDATPLVNLLSRSGREVDVVSLYASDNGQYLAFINKNDDSLWLYELGLE